MPRNEKNPAQWAVEGEEMDPEEEEGGWVGRGVRCWSGVSWVVWGISFFEWVLVELVG